MRGMYWSCNTQVGHPRYAGLPVAAPSVAVYYSGVTPACQLAFLIALMHYVFLACTYVWRCLARVCRHTFYIVVYLFIFRYRA